LLLKSLDIRAGFVAVAGFRLQIQIEALPEEKTRNGI